MNNNFLTLKKRLKKKKKKEKLSFDILYLKNKEKNYTIIRLKILFKTK